MFNTQKKSESAFDPDEILFDSVSMLRSDYMPEGRIEKPVERIYAFLFLFILGVGVSYLFYRAGTLQIAEGAAYRARSQENRFLTRSLLPPRGIIFDRYGEPFVGNSPSFGIRFHKDAFTSENGDLEVLKRDLGRILAKPDEYFTEIGFPPDADASSLPDTFVVAQDIPPDRFVEIAYSLYSLPGISVFENFRRVYEEPYAAAHVVGYLGKASEEDLRRGGSATPDEFIGKSGIEAFYDDYLRGKKGKKIVETDAFGNETNFKLVEESSPGASLETTLDKDLQEVAYRVFSSYVEGRKAGSVVILNPKTGEVLALVSYPSFNSNLFSGSLSEADFKAILDNPLNPLINRPIAGEYAPGSTMKPLYASAALAEGVVTDPLKKMYDPGYIEDRKSVV